MKETASFTEMIDDEPFNGKKKHTRMLIFRLDGRLRPISLSRVGYSYIPGRWIQKYCITLTNTSSIVGNVLLIVDLTNTEDMPALMTVESTQARSAALQR